MSLLALPTGGTFTGDGVSDSQFFPKTVSLGIHTITYNVSQACVTGKSQDVTVVEVVYRGRMVVD